MSEVLGFHGGVDTDDHAELGDRAIVGGGDHRELLGKLALVEDVDAGNAELLGAAQCESLG